MRSSWVWAQETSLLLLLGSKLSFLLLTLAHVTLNNPLIRLRLLVNCPGCTELLSSNFLFRSPCIYMPQLHLISIFILPPLCPCSLWIFLQVSLAQVLSPLSFSPYFVVTRTMVAALQGLLFMLKGSFDFWLATIPRCLMPKKGNWQADFLLYYILRYLPLFTGHFITITSSAAHWIKYLISKITQQKLNAFRNVDSE